MITIRNSKNYTQKIHSSKITKIVLHFTYYIIMFINSELYIYIYMCVCLHI